MLCEVDQTQAAGLDFDVLADRPVFGAYCAFNVRSIRFPCKYPLSPPNMEPTHLAQVKTLTQLLTLPL